MYKVYRENSSSKVEALYKFKGINKSTRAKKDVQKIINLENDFNNKLNEIEIFK